MQGNSKSKDIVQALLAILDGTAEATRADSNDYASSIPPTAEKPLRNLSDTASTIQSAKRPTAQSSDAVAVELETAGDKQVQNAQQEIPDSPPLNSTPSTVLEHATSAQAPLHTDPATAVLTASPHASDPEATKPLAAANASQDTSKEASSAVQVGTPADGIEGDASAEPDIAATVAIMSEAATASGTAVKVRASDTPRSACIADALDTGNATVTGEASLTAEASQHTHPTAMPQATQSADARAADSSIEAAQPAAAAAEHPDCISNPLYEEPCTAHLQAPVSLDAAQQPAPLVATEAPSLTTQPAAAEHNTLAATAPCQLDSSQASSPALLKPAVPPAADTDATNTAEAAVSVTAAEGIPPADDVRPAAATEATAAIPAGEKSAREPTPEDVANLGKAVAAVQARSCQLSPSLLTLQSSADMGSPAHDVFERGKPFACFVGAAASLLLVPNVCICYMAASPMPCTGQATCNSVTSCQSKL